MEEHKSHDQKVMSYEEAMGKHRRVKSIEYIEGYNYCTFTSLVNQSIERGFEPLGPPILTFTRGNEEYNDSSIYLQTMVTYHGD